MSDARLYLGWAKSIGRSWFKAAEQGLEARLAGRETRGTDAAGRWLTENERRLLEALSALIVPSDASSPGAREADVVGNLERRLASAPARQAVYTKGLPGFDAFARKRHGRRFLELSEEQQIGLLEEIDRLSGAGSDSPSAFERRAGRLLRLYRITLHPAALLFPVLVRDVIQTFYASPSAWQWLGYDGPPMPLGYLDLMRRRA